MRFTEEKSQDTLGGKYVGAFAPTYLLGWFTATSHDATELCRNLISPYCASPLPCYTEQNLAVPQHDQTS